MMRKTMLVSFIMLFFAQSVWAEQTTESADVVIVGAGASGITAGRVLTDAGKKVIILEARDRIGGRIWNFKDGDTNIDLGASWIHEVEGNPLKALAETHKITTKHTNYENIAIYSEKGEPYGPKKQAEINKIYEHFVNVAKSNDEYSSLSMLEAYEKYIADEALSKDKAYLLYYILRLNIEHDDAGSIAKMSTEDLHGGIDDDDELIPSGYMQIFGKEAQGLDIRLNTKVTEIQYDRSPVTIQAGERTFSAQKVICTVPLGVLKHKIIKFKPKLPEYKLSAISRLDMGTLNKVYLRFSEVFWPKDREVLLYLPEKYGNYLDFFNLYYYNHQNSLIVFSGADTANKSEALPDSEIIKQVMDNLQKMFPGKVSKLVTYKITRWHQDPMSFGSYSYSLLNANGDEYSDLAKPVNNRLFFAGEATHEKNSATVTGAYLSGIRAGKEVLASFNEQDE